MEESKLVDLFEDKDRYLKSYKTFLSYSAKFEVQDSWTKTVLLDKIVPHLPDLDQDDGLRVLGVGSGSGEVEYPFLTALLKKYPVISNRVVDPAEDQLIQYKALVQSKVHELQGVKFDWRQQTLEQYRATDGEGTKFHFISAIHSMYHIDDVHGFLMYLYGLLEPDGKLLVIVNSDQSGLLKFWSRFPGLWKRGQCQISSAYIRSPFDRCNIPYIQSRQKFDVDITDCFDKTSEEGDLLLDFIVQLSEFKKTSTASQYKEVTGCLASSECSKTDGSKILLRGDWDAIIVTKLSD